RPHSPQPVAANFSARELEVRWTPGLRRGRSMFERVPSRSGGRMKENRQHPRLSIAVDVDVASESNFYAGRTRDLSLGGLFIATDVALPIGIQIDVKLKLPKGSFTLPCEVVWLLSDK